MKAIDKAGNEREATNKDLSVTTGTVTAAEGSVTITTTPTAVTKGNVTVKMSTTATGYTLQYKIGTGNWTNYTQGTTGFTVSANGAVYARLLDSTNQAGATKTVNITNIDKVVPVISSATASTSWAKTNTVTVKATDSGSAGCATGNIGIVGYGINQSNTTQPTYTSVTATTSLSTTINNITANGTYYVWVKDKAGNTANKAVTISKVDGTVPTTATIASSNIEQTTFTLTAKGADGQSGIAKYVFYINGTSEKTVTTTSGTATYNVTGKTANTPYKCKVRVYDNAGNYKDSSEITVTTKTVGVNPEDVAKIGDFVNYSVVVNGTTYNKWRILDFDNNGRMEIVCYNGPSFKLGENGNVTKCKSDYANVIKLLNDASAPYKNGTYGYSTRHLGSNPGNPSSYATMSTSYVKFYSGGTIPTATRAYLEQTHHESDLNAINAFSNTAEGKKLSGTYSWLASRTVVADPQYSGFYCRSVASSGWLNAHYLFHENSNGNESTFSDSKALAPVVSLESGIKINTSLAGNGSENSPWKLVK